MHAQIQSRKARSARRLLHWGSERPARERRGRLLKGGKGGEAGEGLEALARNARGKRREKRREGSLAKKPEDLVAALLRTITDRRDIWSLLQQHLPFPAPCYPDFPFLHIDHQPFSSSLLCQLCRLLSHSRYMSES